MDQFPYETPFKDIPATIPLDRCANCGEPVYYVKVLTGLMKLHERDEGFLCPDPPPKI